MVQNQFFSLNPVKCVILVFVKRIILCIQSILKYVC